MKIIITTLILLSSTLLFGQYNDPRFKTSIGETTPYFEMQSLDGDLFSIQDLKGKIVLIYFFGTYCPPCKKVTPLIQKQFANKYHKDKFVILAIGATSRPDQLLKFRMDHDYDFLYVPDPDQEIYDFFAHNMIPRIVLLDSNQKILFQALGYNKTPFENMSAMIEEAVQKI